MCRTGALAPTRMRVTPHAGAGPPELSVGGPCRCQRGANTFRRDVGHRPTRPRLVVVAKIDTPPGPTKNPTTIRTMPRTTCPWKSWTIPAITRTTAMIHKMVAMAHYYPAAVTQILRAARHVAVATPIVTGTGTPERRARRLGRFPTARRSSPGARGSPPAQKPLTTRPRPVACSLKHNSRDGVTALG